MRRAVTVAAAAALAAVLAAAAAGAGDHAAIVARLNAERAANGLPSDLRENAAWSAKCADHVVYMAATGSLTHVEESSSPQYTADGDWAGANSVLAVGRSWTAGNPFRSAPLHLIQLMSPELRQVGIADNASGYLCITTWPGFRASGWSKPRVYTYPGDGAVGVPFAETADELPFVPADFVGLPSHATTGFNIMVYAEGVSDPWHVRVVSATVTGPSGRVSVRTVDRTTPTVGQYLPPASGFVIPVSPLRPGMQYRATVRFSGALSYSWRFTTASA
jgi:hypothetical protein